jgi:hypothetical protein
MRRKYVQAVRAGKTEHAKAEKLFLTNNEKRTNQSRSPLVTLDDEILKNVEMKYNPM